MDNESTIKFIIEYQSKYFDILNEFFISAIGKSPKKFSKIEDFPNQIHEIGKKAKNDVSIMKNIVESQYKFLSDISVLYKEKGLDAFCKARDLVGYKLVHGGSSRFTNTHLMSTRRAILISDIVLIPDPILPWIEVRREEEKFKDVLLLHTVFILLHVYDLSLTNSLDYPPIFIFPSYEKSLSENDNQTRNGIFDLYTKFFSFYIDSGLNTFEEVIDFVNTRENEFLNIVQKNKLFIAPGSNIDESIDLNIAKYKQEAMIWRSDAYIQEFNKLSEGKIILNGICERIQPFFHLLENTKELSCNPLICIDNQAHYFELIVRMENKSAEAQNVIDNRTYGIIKALSEKKLNFLSKIANEDILYLRKTDQNIALRNELRGLISTLTENELSNYNNIAYEVCKYIDSKISVYNKEMNDILEKYSKKHMLSLSTGLLGLAVSFTPMICQTFELSGMGLGIITAGKYITEKVEEITEKKALKRTLFGIIASAQK